MPYALNGYEQIHFETVGEGPPLIMNNAMGLSSTFTWRHSGWVDALQDDFRLVLMTERGEGLSSKPHNPADYGHALDTRDITAVMDTLGLSSAHYMGWSSGAWRGWFSLQNAPERFRSFILGGVGPYVPDRGPTDPSPMLEPIRQGRMTKFVELAKSYFGDRWSFEIEHEVRGQDIDALIARMQVIERTDPERYLPQLQVPLLTFAGTESPDHDGMRKATALAPHGQFISLEGIKQIDTLYAVDQLAPQVIAFLRKAEEGLAKQTTV